MMTRWEIYGKDGTVKRELVSLGVYGDAVRVVSLEYNGTRMGERFLSVTVESAYPVDFAIGDYIDYRGERFFINYEPTVIKCSRKGTYGKGFTYENVKLNSLGDELVRCDFTDVVLEDNNLPYTSLPKVDFHAATVDDLLDRIQANLNAIYYEIQDGERVGLWKILSPSKDRSLVRGVSLDEWLSYYSSHSDSSDYAVKNQMVSLNNQKCWDALLLSYSIFKLPFFISGRSIMVGSLGHTLLRHFSYGKGNGLQKIERHADSDQSIVTRLRAYGSEDNIPINYYALCNCVPFTLFPPTSVVETTNVTYIPLIDGEDIFPKASTNPWEEATRAVDIWGFPPCTKFTPVRVAGTYDDAISVTNYYDGRVVENNEYLDYLPTYKYWLVVLNEDYQSLKDRLESSEPGVNLKVFFVNGVNKSRVPYSKLGFPPSDQSLSSRMSILNLMLPGFPAMSLYEWVKTHGGTDCDDATGLATWEGYTAYFSKDRLSPYIDSLEVDRIGVRPSSEFFDGSDGKDDIKPTIEEVTIGDLVSAGYDAASKGWLDNTVRIDEVFVTNDILVKDDGIVYETSDGKSHSKDSSGNIVVMSKTFKLYLPYLGFDLKQAIQSSGASCTLSFNDGMLGGREFDIQNVRSSMVLVGTKYYWEVTCNRKEDNTLHKYFPCIGYNASSGDHYVLTGIDLPDAYVDSSSVRLLKSSLDWLDVNDKTRSLLVPTIDPLFMARNREESEKQQLPSLYEKIEEGMMMTIEDDDLGSVSMPIDTLHITEGTNSDIPTFEVTLKDEKSVSSLQKTIENVATQVVSQGVGYSRQEILQMIRQYGSNYYLSKVNQDIASGQITFDKGLRSVLAAIFGDYHREHPVAGDELDTGAAITPDGAADLISLIVRDCVKGDLTVEQAMRASEIVFRNILRSPGGSPDMEGTGIHMDASTGVISTDGLVVRGWAMFRKLIYNYLEIMEQDYQFSGGGDIEEVVDNGDGTYTCYMHKEKEGRHPAIAENDILFGKVDDETGDDGYEYYTSWMRVHSMTLNDGMERDVMVVSLWADNMVPGGKNFAPKDFMTVARRGNTTNPLRQSYWELSGTDHKLTHYWNVTQPILHAENYALVLGILPSILDDDGILPQTRDKSMPSLYVNTIFYEHAHRINWPANVIGQDRGQWVAPNSSIPQPTSEYDRQTIYEPYHYRTFTRVTWLRYRNSPSWVSLTDEELRAKMMQEWKVDLEVSRVWRYGILWECLVDGTTQEPHWNCTDWTPVGGNTIYKGEITTSNGRTFRNGNVDTILTMRVWYGDEEITDTILNIVDFAIVWKRYTGYNTTTEEFEQTSEDLSWIANEVGSDGEPISAGDKTNRIKVLRGDMGSGWMLSYRQALIESTVSFSASGQVVTMPADYVF